MRFSTVLSAALAGVPFFVHANLSDDFRAYRAEHPGTKNIASSDIVKKPAFGDVEVHTKASVIAKAYIVQLKPGSDLVKRTGIHPSEEHAQFHKRASDSIDYDTRFEFTNPSVFFGLSIQVKDDSNATTIEEIPNVLKVWPVKEIPRPSAVGPPLGTITTDGVTYNLTATAGPDADVNSPHKMTEVDRLHALGIKGKGVKIAIMDTGVDYRHPALGGCFGEGCKFSFGKDFVGDDYGDTGVPVPDDDPLATCTGGGHGTHVSGIISMQDQANSTFGLVGVAPEATMGMYRVFGCSGGAGNDVMLLAFQQAATDKVDVLSISVGSIEQWQSEDPFDITTAALEAQGIAVVVAAGNNGGSPALTSSPGTGKKVISIGSVDNAKYPTVYTAEDSNGRHLKYSGSPWPVQSAPTTVLKVYDYTKLAANTTGYGPEGCSQAGWSQVAALVEDKNNSIIAVPASAACTWATKLRLGAAENGFLYGLVYAVADGDVFVQDYNTLEPSNPYFGLTLSKEDGQTLLWGLSHSDDYKLFFKTDTFVSHNQPSSGLMSYFSSSGPTSDSLAIKPQFSAPGESILSTWPLEGTGYAILSGTSMATPYASGSYALVKSQFPDATVQEIRERLQSTAKSIPWAYDSTLRDSVTEQGAGLIDVYNAIFFESAVSPSELNLGDLDALKPRTITIENKSSRTKTYHLTHEPAGETNLQPSQYTVVLGKEPVNLPGQYAQYADVSFSADSVTIKGGESANITATFTPPTDTPDKYLPVYSGFIKVTNNNDEFTITYLGQPYSRQKADYIDNTDNSGFKVPVLLNSNDFYTPIRDIGTFDFNVSNPDGGYPYLEWITLQSSQFFRIEMVPYNTTFVPDFYGFTFNESHPYGVPDSALPLEYPDLPLNYTYANLTSYGIMNEYLANQRPTGYLWSVGPNTYNENGALLHSLPDGDYRAVLRVLRWGTDSTKGDSYQTWLSPIIRAVRGA